MGMDGQTAVQKSNVKIVITEGQLHGTILIHMADPHSQQVVSVRTSIPMLQNITKPKKHHLKIIIATGGIVGLSEGIIDDTFLVSTISRSTLDWIRDMGLEKHETENIHPLRVYSHYSDDKELKPFKLEFFYTIFAFLAIGLLLAFIVFCYEILKN